MVPLLVFAFVLVVGDAVSVARFVTIIVFLWFCVFVFRVILPVVSMVRALSRREFPSVFLLRNRSSSSCAGTECWRLWFCTARSFFSFPKAR